jgi:hypothetical protein
MKALQIESVLPLPVALWFPCQVAHIISTPGKLISNG